mgnify:CR=1 FL=1
MSSPLPEDVKTMKPSKKYYELVIKKTNLRDNEIIVVGDSWERDLKPAKDIELKTVLLSNIRNGSPNYFIEDITKILNIL